MNPTLAHNGLTYTLNKHPMVLSNLKAGRITPAEAADKSWYLRHRVNGKRILFNTKTANSKDAIRRAKDELNARAADPVGFVAYQQAKSAKQSVTLGDLAADWLAAGLPFDALDQRTPSAAATLKENFDRALPWWTAKPVATVDAAMIQAYASSRAPRFTSIDRELSALSCLCKWAVLTSRTDKNPFAKRKRFQKAAAVKHCFTACPDDDETLHKLLAYLFEPVTDKQHAASLQPTVQAAGTLCFCALTGLRPGEPAALRRLPPLAEMPKNTKLLEPGTIFPDRNGVLRMKIERSKRGQNPFVTLHPAAVEFLSAWRAWLARELPDSPQLFPISDDQTLLNRCITRASKALGLPHFKPHAMRAFYVKVRRSQGEDDATISGELGQTTNGALIRSVYGDPSDLMGGNLFDWLPDDCAHAWALLAKPLPKPTPGPTPKRTAAVPA